jgi:hypothetical protein
MKLFFVGGPNQRTDYHIEAGEEVVILLYALTFGRKQW